MTNAQAVEAVTKLKAFGQNAYVDEAIKRHRQGFVVSVGDKKLMQVEEVDELVQELREKRGAKA